MSDIAITQNGVEERFFLTQLIGARAWLQNRKIGKVKDLVAADQGKVAEVTHFQIGRPFGEPALLVPTALVRLDGLSKVALNIDAPLNYVREPSADEVLLRDYLLDKKVLDIEDREVEVVYDVRLAMRNGRLYVVDVDISRYGLLVRIGLKSLATFLEKRARATTKRLIPWSYVQALPPQLSALRGNLKLNVLKETLTDINPVDLADILEELDSDQRAVLLDGMDTEHASDTLEEIEPAVQRDIVFTLKKERAAQLIGDMTPGQAADILSILPAEEKRAILKLLEPAAVAKIEEIIEKQESAILNFSTANYFKCSPEVNVAQARVRFREAAKDMDVVMYFYVTDVNGKLAGVLDIKDLFMADDNALLKDLMVENVISLNDGDTMKRAADLFLRYGFRALPITDENDVILGVVPYRDVMNLKHRILE